MRAKDTLRLETLRGLNALILNEAIATKAIGEFLPDEKVLPLVKRSVKQRKDSIEQFEKGGRKDLADKEKAELTILETFVPAGMNREQITAVASKIVEKLKAEGKFDAKAGGKITGMIMKELASKADGADVKAVVEEFVK